MFPRCKCFLKLSEKFLEYLARVDRLRKYDTEWKCVDTYFNTDL